MEDIRPYLRNESERDEQRREENDPPDWDLAEVSSAEEVPFEIPRD